MSASLQVKTYILVSLFLMTTGIYSNAQEKIENYLVAQKLVSGIQYKKYKDKEKSEDEYARLMIRLMKKEYKKYNKEIEKEYKEEKKAIKLNKDTLLILSSILEASCKKININVTEPDIRPELIAYVKQLKTKKCISETNAENLLVLINKKNLYDSCSIVNQAMGFRNKSEQTMRPKLIVLMRQLKDLGVLSEKNYQKLFSETFPDSVSKIRHIVSFCERSFLSPGNSMFIRDKDEFFLQVNGLTKLAGLDISDFKSDLIILQSDTNNFRAIPVISAIYNGRKFSHLCYEISTTVRDNTDPYRLTGHDSYKIFNQVLALSGSPNRIHEIKEKNPLNYSYTYWSGFVLLTDSQSSALYRNDQLELSYEDYIEKLQGKKILMAMEQYKKTGLLRNLSNDSIDKIIFSLKENPVYRYNELISRFPAISVTIEERIPLTQADAIGLLQRMATISNNAFNPVNVRFEKKSAERVELLFEEKGITRRQEFSSYISWDGIWHLIHDCVFTDANRKGQFEVLRIGQYKKTYIYVTHEQRRILEKEKLIGDY
jgi:hypothetical protein